MIHLFYQVNYFCVVALLVIAGASSISSNDVPPQRTHKRVSSSTVVVHTKREEFKALFDAVPGAYYYWNSLPQQFTQREMCIREMDIALNVDVFLEHFLDKGKGFIYFEKEVLEDTIKSWYGGSECIPINLVVYSMSSLLGTWRETLLIESVSAYLEKLITKNGYGREGLVNVSQGVKGLGEGREDGRRKLGTVTRLVSDEAGLKAAVGDANGNTGDTYIITIGCDIEFTGKCSGCPYSALKIDGSKMNIFGGMAGRKTELRGEGSTGNYRIIKIMNNAEVHLEQLKITNGHYVTYFSLI